VFPRKPGGTFAKRLGATWSTVSTRYCDTWGHGQHRRLRFPLQSSFSFMRVIVSCLSLVSDLFTECVRLRRVLPNYILANANRDHRWQKRHVAHVYSALLRCWSDNDDSLHAVGFMQSAEITVDSWHCENAGKRVTELQKFESNSFTLEGSITSAISKG
jgi:hypothetical protein